jgi:hypothetical protein
VDWRGAVAIVILIISIKGAGAQQTNSGAATSMIASRPSALEKAPEVEPPASDNPADSIDWRERVKAARQRHADWLACIAAKWPDCSPAPVPDPMQPLLNDRTLMNGDIVSTPHGLKVFRGQSTVPHSLADFQ